MVDQSDKFYFFWDAHGIHLFQIKLCTMRCQTTCSLWVYLRLLKVDMFNYVFVCFTAFSHKITSPFIAADALSSIDYKEYRFLLVPSVWCTENCEKNLNMAMQNPGSCTSDYAKEALQCTCSLWAALIIGGGA